VGINNSIITKGLAFAALCLTMFFGTGASVETPGSPIEIEYRAHPALDAGNSKYPGFAPGETVLPAGYAAAPGRRAFSTETILDRDVAIRLRDGVTIYADIYRPAGTQKVPAIVSYGPGGKRNKALNTVIYTPDSATSGLQAWLAQDPAAWVQYGYAVVNVDPRGSYKSEGNLQYLGHKDAEDGYDVIEFLAGQSWCNGKVGMSGNFWDALVQWGIAAQQPPHLAAIAPWDAGDNVFRDEFHRGGITMAQSSVHVRSFGPGLEENMSVMIDKYPLMNAYWQDKIPQFDKIHIPVYHVTSYTTQHTNGDIEAFNSLASKDKWLRVINGHAWIDLHDEKSRADLRRFFDRYLKGEQNGWESTPRVRLAVLDGGGQDIVNRAETSFPMDRQQITKFYLDGATGTLKAQQPASESTVRYKADDEGRTAFTITFDRDTELSGYMNLRLWVEAEGATDMDVFARIVKLDAQGQPLLQDSVTFKYSGPDGRLRVSQRKLIKTRSTPLTPVLAQDTVEPLHTGEIVPVDIPIWPSAMLFHAGQKLQLVIAGYDYMISRPNDRPLIDIKNQGAHIIHTGAKYDSYLLVPVIPPKAERESK
jgi:uncharacterized protein